MEDKVNREKLIEKYWLKRLSGDLPSLTLPRFAGDIEEKDREAGSSQPEPLPPLKISSEAVKKLDKISNQSDVGLFILCLSSLNILLFRYTGLEDVIIGTVTPRKPDVKDKLLFCRNRVSGDLTVKEVANRVKQTVLEAFNYSDYSFGSLYQKLLTRNGSDALDLFNAVFIYEQVQNKSKLLRQFALILSINRREDHLLLNIEYDKNRYSAGTILRFARNLAAVIESLPENLDTGIADIDILSPAEKSQLLLFSREDPGSTASTGTEFPAAQTIQHLVEEQVAKTPGHTAIVDSDGFKHLTYDELNKSANRLTALLRKRGVGSDSIVGLMMDRSIEMVIGQLGILKAGGAYLPIDPEVPTNRAAAMLADSNASFLLMEKKCLKEHPYTILQGLPLTAVEPLLTAPRERITDPDSLPLPDRSLIDNEKYNRFIGQAVVKNRIAIQASRGCPFNCSYCYRIWPRKQKARSGENLFKEIRLYYDIGIRKFDIFMLNLKEGRRLFELIIENKMTDVRLFFPNGFRGDLLTKEYVDLMVKAGTVNFALALETASPRLQKLIDKNLKLDRFREILEYICRQYPGVILELFTMHGIPSETEAEAMLTLDFVKSLKWIHFPYINVLKIYHNTGMERLALENGISREAIARSENMAWHELSDTLPFKKSFSKAYQANFLSEYVLSKERLLKVLPFQMSILTEDEMVQKYDSYLPTDINSFSDLLEFAGISEEELKARQFVDQYEDEQILASLNERIARQFPRQTSPDEGFRVLLLDLSQFFTGYGDMLYDVVDPPLGLIYILTYLNREPGDKINGKILKSRMDFDSLDELKTRIEEFNPQVIGVRSLSYYADFFHEVLAAIRGWGIDVPIIAGGPYATVDYKTILQDRNVDLLVLSEGEVTFCEIISKMIENDGKLPGEEVLKEIDGIAFVPREGNEHRAFARQVLMWEQLAPYLHQQPVENPEPVKDASGLAYIIFTSGSTGVPKGVVVEHRNVVNVLHWFAHTYNVQPGTRVIQLSQYAFDPSVEQIYGTIGHGATLFPANKKIIAHKEQFIRFMERNRVNIINFVPGTLRELLGDGRKLESLRAVISGGEKLEESTKDRLLEKEYALYNQYGPTETTIDALMDRCTKGSITLGRPILNVRCFILDSKNEPVPIGVLGELYIGGAGVSRGYLNRPELTAERFLEFARTHQLVYRTGDLVRWLPDGRIEFAGRIDHQVKIRGYRIELEEIENRLLKHNMVKQAVVLAIPVDHTDRDSETGEKEDKYLTAYIVSEGDPDTEELREFLSWELPDYMVPARFVVLAEMPLTENGKINRAALLEMESGDSVSKVEYAPPTNEIEEKLVEVWQDVLGLDSVGINDNFFAIGGDSIKSIQIASRMNMAGYKVEVKELFHNPTISRLAPLTEKTTKIVDQAIVTGELPLTPIQADFFQNPGPDPFHFNQAVMFYFGDGITEEAVRAVFSKIQAHHDALRMTYDTTAGGEVVQTNRDLEQPLGLSVYDLRGHEPERAQQEFKLRVRETHTGINLEQGPLMKLTLLHMGDGDHLLVVIHHLVVDGVSWRILFEDIETLYRQHKAGEKLELPLKSDSFKTWSEKLSQYAGSPSFLEEKTFWQQMEAQEIPELKRDFDGSNVLKDVRQVSFSLSEEETGLLLTKVNNAFGTEINDILLASLASALVNTRGYNPTAIALEGHGREQILPGIDIGRTVGWFTSVYPVKLEISHEDPGQRIMEIKETLRQVPHKGVGHGILKYLTSPKKKEEIHFKLNPRISFNYLGQFDRDVEQRSFQVAMHSAGQGKSVNRVREYEFDVTGMIANSRLSMSIDYGSKRFKPETIEQLSEEFKNQLLRIISYCSAREKREFTPSDFTYKKLSATDLETVKAAVKHDIEDIYPLTPMQEGMLFLSLLDPDSLTYFVQTSYRLKGELHPEIVRKSLNELSRRYDILRTVFVHEGLEQPLQVVLKDRQVDFYYEDLGKEVPGEGDFIDGETFIRNFKEKDRKCPFNLSRDVLMRVSVIRMGQAEFEFTWSHHHVLMDGWCSGILIEEYFEIYNSFAKDRIPELGPVVPYREYIRWLEKQDKEESKNYWARYLSGYEQSATVPATGSLPGENQTYLNELYTFAFDKKTTGELNSLAVKNSVTLNTLIQSIWGIVLGKYNNSRDVVFGAVVSGRPAGLRGVESMVGLFINTVPVRVRFEKKTTFYRLLQSVQKEVIAGEPYHYYPLAKIQSESTLKQNLLDHILVFENFPIADQIDGFMENKGGYKGDSGLTISGVDAFEQSNYDFNVIAIPKEQLVILFNYNGNIHERGLIEQIAHHLKHISRQLLNRDDSVISELSFLSQEEQERILFDFNDTKSSYPEEKTIHELFEEQVNQVPGNIAVVSGDRQISYKELNKRSGQLARLLRKKGVKPDTVVGLMVDRSLEMIIGILGILKSGGAYLPVDPEYPEARKKFMFADSEISVLLSTSNRLKLRKEMFGNISNGNILLIDKKNIYKGEETNLKNINSAGDLIYVIYTSGSTGKPKGVLVEHKGVVNLVYAHKKIFFGNSHSRFSQVSNPGFDAMAFEIWPCLLSGSVLHIAKNEVRMDHHAIKEWLIRKEINISFQPTIIAEQLLKEEWPEEGISLKALNTAGDKLTVFPSRPYPFRFYNLYGPTEDTVWTTCTEVGVNRGNRKYPTIGTPIGNKKIYILGSNLELLPIGVPGELCISGVGISRGYLNREDLTKEKFITNPFEKNQRLYRTGDLARWLFDGHIEFLGRIDNQVKIRGFRIELGEIENRLTAHENIKEAVVIASGRANDENGLQILTAYIVVDKEMTLSVPQVKEFLTINLPAYMVPSNFVQVGKIPLTANGKIDRKALESQGDKLDMGTTYAAPENKMEKKVADIWKDILKLDRVGVNDNFFDLGGNSIDIIQLNNRVKQVLERDIPIVKMFAYPTIRSLLEYLVRQASGEDLESKEIEHFDSRQDEGIDMMEQTLQILERGQHE